MTTRLQLRDRIARDIRDPAYGTFTSAQVDDLMEDGIAEVSLVYPLQIVEIVAPLAGIYYYAVRSEHTFRVEVYRDDEFYREVDQADGPSQSGYDLHASTIFIPKTVIDNLDPDTDDIRIWGYTNRKRPTADGEVLELDDRAEFAVRAYAQWKAYQLLANDRTLFKQWQAQTKNTDISVNQVLTTAQTYSREWDRKRNHLRTVRRS